jgi:hypothetical protein
MLTDASAYNSYAIPCSTKDVDIMVSLSSYDVMAKIICLMKPKIIFILQVQFDTITRGKRHYIRNWCSLRGTTLRLETILASLPPTD